MSAAALFQQQPCPRCQGEGEERDMETGYLIVCRDCSGRRWVNVTEGRDE
jgi:DnaJ-class molecular chaperone